MKKIIVGILSFAFLFIGQSSFAAVSSVQWNGDPSDCHTIAVANYTTGVGFQDPCWPLSSVSAESGETINVRIYYHNSGNSTATNTRIILNAPTGTSSTQTFTGQITSDQGSLSFGPATVNIPSGQSLSFGSTRWYPNQSQTASGSSGSDVINGGINIGSIAPGWSTQGSVVVSFKVSSTTPPVSCAITNFNASSTSITAGQSTTLNWSTSGCISANIQTTTDNGSSVATSGSKTYSPAVTTTYTLVATGSDWVEKRQSLTVTVTPVTASCAINSFTASPTLITLGQSTILTWNTSNCISANIQTTTDNGSSVATSGSKPYFPVVTTTYTLVATGSDGVEKTRSITIIIGEGPSCVITSFNASSTSITAGQSTTLNWSTSGCISGNIQTTTDNGSTVNVTGSKTYSPAVTTTYILVVVAPDWVTEKRQSLTVTVTPVTASCAINNFSASPTSITRGQSSNLSWGTTNCTNVTISNLGYNVPTSGTQAVWPTVTTTYVLTAYGSNGNSISKSVIVNVNAASVCSISNFTASPTSITSGGSSTLNWNTSNCTSVSLSGVGAVNLSGTKSVTPTQTTTYTLTAYGQNIGDDVQHMKSVTVAVNQPAVCEINYFTAFPTQVTPGQPSILSWGTTNCTTAAISNADVSISGTKIVYPTITTTYVLTAHGLTGVTQSKSVTISVTQQSVCAINSFTATPTSITSGQSSTLNWNTSNCVNVTISNLGYNVPTSGTQAVWPTQTTTYTLTATGANGVTRTSTATVSVNNIVYNNCSINSFTANPTSITAGQSSTLSWNTSDCISASISSIGSVSVDGSRSVSPTTTTTYTLTATGANGVTRTSTATVSVNDVVYNNCLINNFTATPTSITSGGSSTLNWNTSDCTNVTISNLGYNVPTSGTQAVWPTQTTTYTLTATGANGVTRTGTATVYVNQPAICVINNFTSTPASITSGQSSTLSWNTSDCTSANIGGENVATSGSKQVYPTQTTTYTLTAIGTNGVTRTSTTTVYVNQPVLCSINFFTATPTSITSGQSSVLKWATENCINVTISNLGYNVPTTSTGQSIYPTVTTTYTLTATGTSGVVQTRALTVYVNDIIPDCSITSFTASDTSINDGDYTTLRWNTNGCVRVKISDIGNVSEDGSERVYPTDDTTYILTAYDENGHTITRSLKIYVDSNNNDCSIDSFTASNTDISSGELVTLRWGTSGCTSVNISDIGNVPLDGSRNVYPYESTTYTLRAYGPNGGSQTRSIVVNMDNGYKPPVVIYNSNVVTTVATNISQTGAQLNGLITSSNYTNASVYFEYGTTVNLGSRTSPRPTSGNTNFSEFVSTLSPNTIYFFQAFATSPNGISRGAIEVFKTLGYNTNYNTNTNTNTVQTVRQVVVQGTTVYGSQSPLILRIENRYQNIGVGDIIDYTVYYKNISSSTLYHPMVQVFIPQGITLTNTSRGTYSENDKTLSVPIEDLIPGAEGFIYLQARVDRMDANLAQIVTTAILVYTNPNGAQENAMAYVLNNPKIGNSNMLGASAFFGNFLGFGLLGWLLLIILILLIALIARSFYNDRRNTTTTTTERTISQ